MNDNRAQRLVLGLLLVVSTASPLHFCCSTPPKTPRRKGNFSLHHLNLTSKTHTDINNHNIWPSPTFINIQTASRLRFSPRLCLNLQFLNEPSQPHSTLLASAFHSFCSHLPLHSDGNLIHTIQINVSKDTMLGYNNDESYSIRLQAPTSFIKSSEPWGTRHALETILQLTDMVGDTFPGAVVDDHPQYPWRGLLIDTARHFITVTTIQRTIRAMAMNKYNVLHWHITDAQSFPLLFDAAPELALLGAHHPNLKYDFKDVQSIVSLSQSLGIRIVPEIDMPSHTASWSAAYPDIVIRCRRHAASNADRFKATDKDTLDPTLDKTFRVIQSVLKGLSKMFPDNYIHLGGDEVDYRCLSSKPDVMKRAVQQHGKGTTALDVLQHFWDRVTQMVLDLGKIPMVWQGAFDGRIRLRKEVVVQTWQCWGNPILGVRSMKRALRVGHRVIQSSCWYLDWDSRFIDFYEQNRMNSIDDNNNAALKDGGGLMGGEMCAWSETMDESNLECRLWPRALSAGERLWSSSSSINRVDDDVSRRRVVQQQRMLSRGYVLSRMVTDYCGQIVQHLQRDVLSLSSSLSSSSRNKIPHFYIRQLNDLNESGLEWITRIFDQHSIGYMIVCGSRAGATDRDRQKQISTIAKNVGMPYYFSCLLQQTGHVLLLFGLHDLPSVDCSHFRRRYSGIHHFVNVQFATRKHIKHQGNSVGTAVSVLLEAMNGMKASIGTQRLVSGL